MSETIGHGNHKLSEYPLPLRDIPFEVDDAWTPWFVGYEKSTADDCRVRLQARFRNCSAILRKLASRIMQHVPHSLFVYEGTPSLRLLNDCSAQLCLCVPPELDRAVVQRALLPYKLENHRLLVEMFALFGGIYEQKPNRRVGFAGKRRGGQLIAEPAALDFEAGFEFLTEIEVQERENKFSRWATGVQVLHGDDGDYWHIGSDGSVCWHECGDPEVGGVFSSLEDLIGAVLESSTAERLFHGLYDFLPGMQQP